MSFVNRGGGILVPGQDAPSANIRLITSIPFGKIINTTGLYPEFANNVSISVDSSEKVILVGFVSSQGAANVNNTLNYISNTAFDGVVTGNSSMFFNNSEPVANSRRNIAVAVYDPPSGPTANIMMTQRVFAKPTTNAVMSVFAIKNFLGKLVSTYSNAPANTDITVTSPAGGAIIAIIAGSPVANVPQSIAGFTQVVDRTTATNGIGLFGNSIWIKQNLGSVDSTVTANCVMGDTSAEIWYLSIR